MKITSGIIDNNGQYLCEPIYDFIKHVIKYDTFIVKKDDKFGILNKDGLILIKPQYLHISPYTNMDIEIKGYEVTQDAGVGWLSLVSKEILPPEFKNFKQVNNILVAENRGYESCKIFTLEGKKLDHMDYSSVTDLGNGYARVVKNREDGIIDKDGNLIIPCEYDFISSFIPGKPIGVKGSNGFWGFINEENKLIIDYQFDSLLDKIPFTKEYTRVQKDNKIGVIDQSGKIIIPIEYEALGNPQEDYIAFMTDEEYGYIDYENNQYTLQFDERENKFVYKDKNGKHGHKTYVEDAFELIENSIYAEYNGKWGMLDGKNSVIVDIVYYEIAPSFCSKLAYVRKGDRYAFLHKDKGLITDFVYP